NRDPIDTTRILQAINAVAGLGDNDMSAVGQMPGNLFAVLWRRDRIHVAGKNQQGRIGRNRLVETGRNLTARPHSAGARLLEHAITPKRITGSQRRRILSINQWYIFGTG